MTPVGRAATRGAFLILLLQVILFAQKENCRVITVRVVADDSFRLLGTWKFDFLSLIKECGLSFRSRFRLDFQALEFEYWSPGDAQRSMADLLQTLISQVPRVNSDIVLGLVSSQKTNENSSGIASYLDGAILLRFTESFHPLKLTLIHELCHIFGAVDLQERGSIMGLSSPGLRFDEFTSQMVRLNMRRSFSPHPFPLSVDKLDAAIALCQQRDERRLDEAGLDLLMACLYQEKQDWASALEKIEGALRSSSDPLNLKALLAGIISKGENPCRSIAAYRELLAGRSGFAEIHYHLGLALMRENRLDEALQEFRRSADGGPGQAKAYAQMAYLLLSRGQAGRRI